MKLLPHLKFSFLVFLALAACTSKTGQEVQSQGEIPAQATSGVDYDVSEEPSSLDEYFQLEHIKEWYPDRFLPPPFDYDIDLSDKSIAELWLLRNEIFARNGYLFDDAVLRGHFNQFKWYQPIFDVPDFRVRLSKRDQAFVDRVIRRENELSENRYVKLGAYQMINTDHVFNVIQFKSIDDKLMAALSKNNFAIVPAQHEQLFHVYDKNHYEYIPNFITTDIYLQVLHKHFSSMLQKVEEDKFVPLLTTLLKNLYYESVKYAKGGEHPRLESAAEWTSSYLGVAYSLITSKNQAPTNPTVKEECRKIISAQGMGSDFLGSDFISYHEFKPRGNYTDSPGLESYFRCVKWLNTAPIVIEDDDRLLSALLIASFIKKSPESLSAFGRYSEALKFIVGEEDNLSISSLIQIISDDEAREPDMLTKQSRLQEIRAKLTGAAVDRIRPRAGDDATDRELSAQNVLFTAGRYTFDAEILSRLIHVLRPEPQRTFPKGLDVFASLGNERAKDILLNEYDEQQKWPAFTDTLKVLQKQFAAFNEWDKSIYTKTFHTISALDADNKEYPLFMKTQAWSKKNLSTSLAAWTELKHDLLLYSERPYAAQAGEGGGPPPPLHVSYVEPNVAFWERSIALLNFQENRLESMGLMNEDIRRIIVELKEIGNLLLTVSKKQLAKERVSNEEFMKLSYLGGQIEYLTFRIFGSDHLPEKERLVAVVADVYDYNGTALEEAVGMVDEIYVVAEINGKPYLTKGAVFSYYEFTSDTPLSDEEWRQRVTSGNAPDRPMWMKEILVEVEGLESKKEYSF